MAKQKVSEKEKYALPKWFWVIAIAIAVFIASSVGYYFIDRTGWPDYIQALSKCGGRPPIQADNSWIFSSNEYIMPSDEAYRIPKPQQGSWVYFCSEAEAQTAGYKHLGQ